MNLVVYVADALRTDHVGCYGSTRVRTPTIDAFAAGGRPLRPGDQRRPVDGAFDHLDPHRPVPAPPRLPALGRRPRPGDPDPVHRRRRVRLRHGLASSSTRTSCSRASPTRTSPARRETVDGAAAWLKEHADRPFCLWFHSWGAAHAVRRRSSPSAASGGRRSTRSSTGSSRATPRRYRRCTRATRRRSSASRRRPSPRSCRRSRTRACASDTAIVFLADHGESWGERYADKTAGAGHLPHARRDAVRRDPRGAADPLRARASTRRSSPPQVSLVDVHADAARARRRAARRARRRVARLCVEDDRPAVAVRTDKGSLAQIALRVPPWKAILDLESGGIEAYRLDLDPGELEPRTTRRGASRSAARRARGRPARNARRPRSRRSSRSGSPT